MTRARSLSLIGWALFALALTSWWSRLGAADYREQFFLADLLVWPTVIEDTLVRGHAFAGAWHLTPAPYFFPDALIAAATRLVFDSIEERQYAGIVLQLVLLAFALSWMCKAISPELGALGPALTTVVVMLAQQDRQPFIYFLYPTFHVGVAIVCATALGIVWRQPTERWKWVLLALVLAAGAASDVLVLVFFLGAVVTMAARSLSTMVKPLAWGVPPTILGAALARLVPFPDRDSTGTRFKVLAQTLSLAWAQWNEFDVVLRVVLPLGCVALGFVAWRAREPLKRSAALGLLGGVVATVVAVLVAGNLVAGAWNRYLLWPVLAAMLGLVLVPSRITVWLSLGAAALLVVLSGQWARFPTSLPVSRWRAEAACVDELLRSEHATGVVSDYWHAKPLALFSTAGASPAQFDVKLKEPHLWITTHTWYRPKDGFALAIHEGFEDAAFSRELGADVEERPCGSFRVAVFRGEARTRLENFVTSRAPAE